jgi:hypothetical protein
LGFARSAEDVTDRGGWLGELDRRIPRGVWREGVPTGGNDADAPGVNGLFGQGEDLGVDRTDVFDALRRDWLEREHDEDQ